MLDRHLVSAGAPHATPRCRAALKASARFRKVPAELRLEIVAKLVKGYVGTEQSAPSDKLPWEQTGRWKDLGPDVIRTFQHFARDADGPECVHTGYEDDRPVAFVCAQVWPGNGWSRIAYMGPVPAARGRGLGRWVHRHGFHMIRSQGGTRCHGDTATDNPAMIRLFFAHGCVESERMHDFEWSAEEGSQNPRPVGPRPG